MEADGLWRTMPSSNSSALHAATRRHSVRINNQCVQSSGHPCSRRQMRSRCFAWTKSLSTSAAMAPLPLVLTKETRQRDSSCRVVCLMCNEPVPSPPLKCWPRRSRMPTEALAIPLYTSRNPSSWMSHTFPRPLCSFAMRGMLIAFPRGEATQPSMSSRE